MVCWSCTEDDMGTFLQQDQVLGWGVGHQGERLFNTASGLQPTYRESADSFLDESDVDPYDAIYGELDLGRVYGQQLAVWSHRSPEMVSLFTPVEGDTFVNIVAFARSTLEFNTAVDKMMVLLPGHKRPLDMESVFLVKPGTAIIIAPLYDYMVTIEVKQLGHRIDLVLNITMSVQELKSRLQTERGYPSTRMDLLYKDRPLQNDRYLFEYGLAHSSTIFVLLQLKNDVLVHVETFWGKRYHLYVDPCTTGFAIIASVLRRTVSQNVLDVGRLYELFLPKHTLVLYCGSRALDWDHCLGFYDLQDNSLLTISTIGLAHDMAIQKVPILLDSGRQQHLLASKFDRWSTVALKLHGMTGYPVNLIKVTRPNRQSIDFSDVIGPVSSTGQPFRLDVSAVGTDDDLLYGIPLKFKIARGVTELLKVAPSRSIQSVKETLERVGVPNASMYDLMVDGVRLANSKRVVDVIEEYKVPIELSLRQYPVFIHGHQNVIFKLLAHSKETLATFLMRVKMKTGLSFQDYLPLICGTPLDEAESLPVFDTRLSVKSSIFLVPRKQNKSFFILHGDWLSKLRLPTQPKMQQIKETLWRERNIPEGALASLGSFLQWYFGASSSHHPAVQDTGLKERMVVYEGNIGNKFIYRKDELAPEEGGSLGERREQTRRAGMNSLKKTKQGLKPADGARHMSADGAKAHRHQNTNMRKAYTTGTGGKHVRGRRERLAPPKYKNSQLAPPKFKNSQVAPPTYKYSQVNEPEDATKEWVFCLRHDYTIPAKSKTSHH
ncbi:uncharacterized protein LOC131941272 [Physella acuta]|uniref:uncharacterized protein LOC131941272 n=1 Tax=Physella acuta TaxID=109671 RepID=UPI0027DD7360|nr:uncharacterized protein LOC131941272 [Physella acuta]XP_059156413.1 uncharacterized protein LOC131941272 [Physella acuta]